MNFNNWYSEGGNIGEYAMWTGAYTAAFLLLAIGLFNMRDV